METGKTSMSDDGWMPHDGGECPVPENAIVRIRIRNGHISAPERARTWTWNSGRRPHRYDIVEYRLEKGTGMTDERMIKTTRESDMVADFVAAASERLTPAQWELLELLEDGDRDGITDARTARALERRGLAAAGAVEGEYGITDAGRRRLATRR